MWLHYSGNVEFEKETDSALGGWKLFWSAMTGATPAMAPGTMTLLALIGFCLTLAPVSRETRDPRP
jgi:hypothetical protein